MAYGWQWASGPEMHSYDEICFLIGALVIIFPIAFWWIKKNGWPKL